jgi:hypothetical protein
MRLALPSSPAAKSPRPGVISTPTKDGARAPLRTAWAESVTPLYVVVTMGIPIFISSHDYEAGNMAFRAGAWLAPVAKRQADNIRLSAVSI